MLDLYQQPGIDETVSIDHIKRHYYMTHEEINPTRIVPLGPIVDLTVPPPVAASTFSIIMPTVGVGVELVPSPKHFRFEARATGARVSLSSRQKNAAVDELHKQTRMDWPPLGNFIQSRLFRDSLKFLWRRRFTGEKMPHRVTATIGGKQIHIESGKIAKSMFAPDV